MEDRQIIELYWTRSEAAIERTAEKYGGVVNRQFEEGVFATEILLPLSDKSEQSAEIQA